MYALLIGSQLSLIFISLNECEDLTEIRYYWWTLGGWRRHLWIVTGPTTKKERELRKACSQCAKGHITRERTGYNCVCRNWKQRVKSAQYLSLVQLLEFLWHEKLHWKGALLGSSCLCGIHGQSVSRPRHMTGGNIPMELLSALLPTTPGTPSLYSILSTWFVSPESQQCQTSSMQVWPSHHTNTHEWGKHDNGKQASCPGQNTKALHLHSGIKSSPCLYTALFLTGILQPPC